MNPHATEHWQDLARVWQTGSAPVTVADIEKLHERQRHRLRVVRAVELTCMALGIFAALWLVLTIRLRWVGILTVAFSVASVFFVLRARRESVPPGSTDLLEALKDSLAYQEWLAEQLRYGRVLGFVALFAVVMVASTQLMHVASATRSGLLATAIAALAIAATVAWNMALAWRVWRCTARLKVFTKTLTDVS